jgi:hypothetical protein
VDVLRLEILTRQQQTRDAIAAAIIKAASEGER